MSYLVNTLVTCSALMCNFITSRKQRIKISLINSFDVIAKFSVNIIIIISLIFPELYILNSVRNTPENSPNLGVSILSSELSPLGDEIRGLSTSHAEPAPLLRTHPTLV